MEREAKDRSGQWLMEHQGEAMLRVAGVQGYSECKPLRTMVVHPKMIPDGVFEVYFPDKEKPAVYILEVTTYPDVEEKDQVMKGAAIVLLERNVIPEVISIVL